MGGDDYSGLESTYQPFQMDNKIIEVSKTSRKVVYVGMLPFKIISTPTSNFAMMILFNLRHLFS